MHACASVTKPAVGLMDFLNAIFKFAAFWAAFARASCELLFEINYSLC